MFLQECNCLQAYLTVKPSFKVMAPCNFLIKITISTVHFFPRNLHNQKQKINPAQRRLPQPLRSREKARQRTRQQRLHLRKDLLQVRPTNSPAKGRRDPRIGLERHIQVTNFATTPLARGPKRLSPRNSIGPAN